MRFRPLRHLLPGLVALVLLAACHDKDKPQTELPGGATPEAAVQIQVKYLKAADFAGFWKHSLPPADYATLRADWPRQHAGDPAPSAEDSAAFEAKMKEFTDPGAEDKLYAQAKPLLAQWQRQYSDQLPFIIGVMQGIARTALDQNRTMTPAQKQQTNEVLDAFVPWAQQQSSWFDQAKAKQAIDAFVATARQLDLKHADQLRAMDFDTAMQKYGIGFTGLKNVLAVYGLSIDQTFDSVKLTPLESANGHARVKIDYTLLGKPLSTEATLVQQDGRWYSEDLLQNVRDAHLRLEAPVMAASAPAPASSARATTAQAHGATQPPAKR
ncbi:hypothetical protein RKE25_21620 [Dyella sp. BiH032]|uniref:hypothetical protein n=1 Tax=Dyella sp. BiH032 TaxID=3075430 RepID=UPI002892CEC3|nr:hypothetical protein [Dyella sp. BiH032]WNL45976.1 hypothetical protein RKE25_21620 [Dyella sp. BiH032]